MLFSITLIVNFCIISSTLISAFTSDYRTASANAHVNCVSWTLSNESFSCLVGHVTSRSNESYCHIPIGPATCHCMTTNASQVPLTAIIALSDIHRKQTCSKEEATREFHKENIRNGRMQSSRKEVSEDLDSFRGTMSMLRKTKNDNRCRKVWRMEERIQTLVKKQLLEKDDRQSCTGQCDTFMFLFIMHVFDGPALLQLKMRLIDHEKW